MKVSKLLKITTLVTLGLGLSKHSISAPSNDGFVVITNIATPVSGLTKKQIKSLYLGAPTDLKLIPLMLDTSLKTRQIFNAQVMGLSESRLQSFLAQMRFSGRSIDVVELESVKQAIDKVTIEHNTIAYVPEGTAIPRDVKIVFRYP